MTTHHDLLKYIFILQEAYWTGVSSNVILKECFNIFFASENGIANFLNAFCIKTYVVLAGEATEHINMTLSFIPRINLCE